MNSNTNLINMNLVSHELSNTVIWTGKSETSINLSCESVALSNARCIIDNLYPNLKYRFSYDYEVISGKCYTYIEKTPSGKLGETQWSIGKGSHIIEFEIGDSTSINIYLYLIDNEESKADIIYTNIKLEVIEDELEMYKNNFINVKIPPSEISNTVVWIGNSQISMRLTCQPLAWSNARYIIENLSANKKYRLSYDYEVISGKCYTYIGKISSGKLGESKWSSGKGNHIIEFYTGIDTSIKIFFYIVDNVEVNGDIYYSNVRLEILEDEEEEYNKVYISSFPRVSGENDDSGRINRAIQSLKAKDLLIFEKNITYTVNKTINILDKNNIIIDGNQCTIKSNFNSGNLIYCGTTRYYDKQSIAFNITSGQYIFKLSIPNAKVGDILEFRSVGMSWDYNQSYTAWGKISEITTTTVTIQKEHASKWTFTADLIRAYRCSDSVTIKNFNTVSGSKQINLKIENHQNSLITSINMYGNGGQAGVWYCRNINTNTTNCNIDYFNDRTTSNGTTGYGIQLFGYNCTASGNIIKRCGSSTTNGYGTGLVFKENILYEAPDSYPFTDSLLASHAMSDCTCINNTLYVYSNVKAFSLRGWYSIIRDNVIILPENSAKGTENSLILCLIHSDKYTPVEYIEFSGNLIKGNFFNRYGRTVSVQLYEDKINGSVKIINNKFNGRIDIQGKGAKKTGSIQEWQVNNNYYTSVLQITDSMVNILKKVILPNTKVNSF